MPDPLIALFIGLGLLVLSSLLVWPNGGLIGHLQRVQQLSERVLREDALKQIHKAESEGQTINLERLAGALQIKTNRAAELVANMQEKELITLKGETFLLTPTGQDYALKIIRAHRLWERYLSEETGYEESKWHDIAEQLEHQVSSEELELMASQLGNPTHDPHGDPIPTIDGEIVQHGGKPLSSMPDDSFHQIVHMEDEPEAVYAQLIAEGLYPGMEIQLLESSPKRIRFWGDGEEHILAPIVAASISVVPKVQVVDEISCVGEPLYALKPGQSGEVVALSPRLRGGERRRMMDLGILPGTIIQSEMVSPSGDPTAYRVRGALIALRKEQAELIRITQN